MNLYRLDVCGWVEMSELLKEAAEQENWDIAVEVALAQSKQHFTYLYRLEFVVEGRFFHELYYRNGEQVPNC